MFVGLLLESQRRDGTTWTVRLWRKRTLLFFKDESTSCDTACNPFARSTNMRPIATTVTDIPIHVRTMITRRNGGRLRQHRLDPELRPGSNL